MRASAQVPYCQLVDLQEAFVMQVIFKLRAIDSPKVDGPSQT